MAPPATQRAGGVFLQPAARLFAAADCIRRYRAVQDDFAWIDLNANGSNDTGQNIAKERRSMAKAYWITTYRSISNPEALAAYAKLAAPALSAQGGRFLARGMPIKAKEHGLMQRTVLIEFPSLEVALAAYDSPAYKEALDALGPNAAERDIRIIEAVE
jgi:uncharacterized protein (DUF1330 family)